MAASAPPANVGRAPFVYNMLGMQLLVTHALRPVPAGTRQVRMEFHKDDGSLVKGGDVTLYYGVEKAGAGA